MEGELSAIPKSPERREYHLDYEIWMLDETSRRHYVDEVVNNALIESFCLHARNLFEFFAEEAPQYTQDYRPFSHISMRERKAILRKLNVHVTHVKSQGRATNDADKITDRHRAEIRNILSDEITEFRSHLRPEYSDVEIRDLPRAIFLPSLPQWNTTTSSGQAVAAFYHSPPRKSG
jgi:hypothetical protein